MESFEAVQETLTSIEDLHDALADAVHRQLMSDVPYGVLLSGGLDSSVTSALAKRFASKGGVQRHASRVVPTTAFFFRWT